MIPLNVYSGILANREFEIILDQEGYTGTVGGDMTWWAELNYKPDAISTIIIDISGGGHGEFAMTKVTDTVYKYQWRTYYDSPTWDYDENCTAFVKATYKGKAFVSNTVELIGG